MGNLLTGFTQELSQEPAFLPFLKSSELLVPTCYLSLHPGMPPPHCPHHLPTLALPGSDDILCGRLVLGHLRGPWAGVLASLDTPEARPSR